MNTDRPIQAVPTGLPQGARPVPPLVSRRSLASFTLIELLVVVAIILILMGLTLKVMSMVNRKTATARTLVVLEQVKGALGAYYAAYGSYPNTTTNASVCEYQMPSTRPPTTHTYKGLTAYIISGTAIKKLMGGGYAGGQNTMDYLNSEASRWDYYWDKIGDFVYRKSAPTNSADGGSMYKFTNLTVVIHDGWGRDIQYCPMTTNNQEGYYLWSIGPDGANNNRQGDDIVVTFD